MSHAVSQDCFSLSQIDLVWIMELSLSQSQWPKIYNVLIGKIWLPIPTAPVKVHVNSRRVILREKSMNHSRQKWVTAKHASRDQQKRFHICTKHASRDQQKRFHICTFMVSCWKILCGLMNCLPFLTRLWVIEKQGQCFLYVLPLHLAQMPDP